jgi:hypothetical protein
LIYHCNGHNPGLYERGIVPAIYPSITKWSYQAEKPDKMFLGNHDHWFYKHHQGTDVYKMMEADIKNLLVSLDKRFLLKMDDNIIGFKIYRKMYLIGSIKNFSEKKIILDF